MKTNKQARPNFFKQLILAFFSAVLIVPPSSLYALPSGLQVSHGQLNASGSGGVLQLDQLTPQAIANWQSFSIGAGQQVNIQQLGIDSVLLNRVMGADPSQLMGQLNANGRVYLINPNGIVVGKDASINTADFMASALDISDADFLNGGDMLFEGDSTASVLNLGKITASNGDVILIGHKVANSGEISAPQGVAALGAGNEVLLMPEGDQRIFVKTNLDYASDGTGVDNSGVIDAASAELKAAGGNIYEMAINQSGIVQATEYQQRGGRVLITAKDGFVAHSGTIKAENADGSGGEVLLGGDYRGENAAILNAARTVVTSDAVIDVSATAPMADAGRAIVWAEEATRFLGTIQGQGGALGGNGAFAEVSGKQYLDFQGLADLTASNGQNGQLLLDPNSLTVLSVVEESNITGSGTNPFTFGRTDSFVESFLAVATLEAQLALSGVILDTSFVGINLFDFDGIPEPGDGTIAVEDAVTWTSGNSLTFKSGNNIKINADLSGTGAEIIFSGGSVLPERRNPFFDGAIEVAANATITAETLTINRNPDAAYSNTTFGGQQQPIIEEVVTEGPIGGITIAGALNVTTLDVQLPAEPSEEWSLSGGVMGALTVNNPNNQIEFLKIAPTVAEPGNVIVSDVDIVDGSGGLTVLAQLANILRGGLSIITEGDLTLQSGTYFNGSDGDMILASKSGSFINNAGPQAIAFTGDLSDTSRFLIYSDDPANTVKGGLAGNPFYNASFAGNAPGTITQTGNRFVYSLAPTLTVSANGSRGYGDAAIDYTQPVTGLVGGDLAEDAFSGAPTLSAPSDLSANVGIYAGAVSVGLGTLASDFGYQMAVADGDLTINKATLTVTPNPASREYGDANPSLSGAFTGFKNSETLSVIDTLPTFSTNALITSNVGSYAINGSGGLATNYDFSFADGTDLFSITPAPLVISADNASRIYGAANPGFSASLSGEKNGDNLSDFPNLTYSTPDSDVNSSVLGGPYTIAVGGASNANYTYTYSGGELTITPAELTIRADDYNHPFNNDVPDVSLYTASFEGLVADDVKADYDGQPVFSNTTDGSTLGDFDIDVAGVADSNYNIRFESGTLSILNQVLTVVANSFTRIYGGANPTFTYQPITGFVGEDDESVLTNPVSFSTVADVNSGVGVYDIVPGGATADNYQFNFVNGSLTVDPALLTIRAQDASRLYGATDPTFGADFFGLVADDVKADITGLTFATNASLNSGVGDSYTITPGNGSNNNYTISYEAGALSITPATLLIEANDKTRDYGAADPEFDANFVGLVAGDTKDEISGLVLSTDAQSDSDAGLYTITASGASDANYNISFGEGAFTVNPATLIIRADDFSRVYGDANPNFTFDFEGFVLGDTVDDLGALSLSTDALNTSLPGAFDILVFGGANDNYSITREPGTLTINKRPINVIAEDQTRVFGDPDPDFAVSFQNLAPFDTSGASLFLNPRTDATRTSNVGEYEITMGVGVSDRYIPTPENGTLTITPRPTTITALEATREYGDPDPEFNISTIPQVSGAPLGRVGLSFTTAAVQSSDVGVYTLMPGGIINDNYTVQYVPADFRITPASLMLRGVNQAREYGLANAPLQFNSTGFKLGQGVEDVFSNFSISTSASQTSNVGSYTIDLAGDVINDNYDVTLDEGTLTITKAPLFVAPSLSSRLYGDANPNTYELTAAGLRNDDTESVVRQVNFQNFTFPDRNVGIAANVVQIVFATARNYNLSLGRGSMNILPRPLKIIADDASREYGDANPTFTTTLDGLASFDDRSVIPDVSVLTTASEASNVLEGGYGLIPQSGTNSNYDISYEPGKLTITPAQLILSLAAATRQYATANPDVGIESAFGFKLSDGIDDLFLEYSTTAEPTSDVGNYLISATSPNPNYLLNVSPNVLTITPAPLTLLIDLETRLERQYGDPNVEFADDLIVGGLQFGAAEEAVVRVTNPTQEFTPMGEYFLQAEILDPNYEIVSFANNNFFIQQRKVDLVFNDASKFFGDEAPDLSNFLDFDGVFAPGDTLETVFAPFRTDTNIISDVGDYPISASSINSNYGINSVTGDFTIKPRPITIFLNPASRIYGEANPTIYDSYIRPTGFEDLPDFDNLNDVLEIIPPSLQADVGEYALSANLINSNYELSAFDGRLDITPREINLALPEVRSFSRVYAEPNPDVGEFVQLDSPGAFNRGVASFDTIDDVITFDLPGIRDDAGQYFMQEIITKSPNYNIDLEGEFEFFVEQRPIILKGPFFSRIYGEMNPELEYSDITPPGPASGLASFDVLTEQVALANVPDERAGVGSYGLQVASRNYSVFFGEGGQITVTPRELTIIADNFTRVFGEENGRERVNIILGSPGRPQGLASFDSEEDVLTRNYPTIESDVGVYELVIPTNNPNYFYDRVEGTGTVTPRPITVQGSGFTRVYGADNPEFDPFAVIGNPAEVFASFHSEEDVFILRNLPNPRTSAGEYSIFDFQNSNYDFTINGLDTYNITKRPLFLTVSNQIRNYGDPVGRVDITRSFTGTDAGPASFDTIEDIVSANLPAQDAEVGRYDITLDLLDQNYTINQVRGPDFGSDAAPYSQILQRFLTIELPGIDRLYGDANELNGVNIVSGSLPEFASIEDIFAVNLPGIGARPGDYRVVDYLDEKNYGLSVRSGSEDMTISKRRIRVDALNTFNSYGDTDYSFEFAITGDGLAARDSVENTITPILTDSSEVLTNVGHYGIVGVEVDPDYYTVDSFTPGVFTLLPRPVTMNIREISLSFDSIGELSDYLANEDLVVRATINNLAPGETIDDAFPIIRYQIVDRDRTPFLGTIPTEDTIVMPAASVFANDPDLIRLAITLQPSTDVNEPVTRTGSTVTLGDNATLNRFVTVFDGFGTEAGYFLSSVNNASVRLRVPSEVVQSDPQVTNGSGIVLSNGPYVLSESNLVIGQSQTLTIGSGRPGITSFFSGGNHDLGVDMITGLFQSLMESGEIQYFAEGSLFYEITRSNTGTLEDLTPFRIQRWFERNAGNPEAMALLSEPLSHYAAGFLDKDPNTYTESESRFATLLAGHLGDARREVAKRMEDKKNAWIQKEEANGANMADLAGKDVPWEDFMKDAAGEYVAEDVEAKVALAVGGTAVGAGAAAGVMVGLTGAILPFAVTSGASIAAGATVTGVGTTVTATTVVAAGTVTTASGSSMAVGTTVSIAGSTATAAGAVVLVPAAIVAGAIVGSIARGIQVVENAEQEKQYNAIQNSVGSRINLNNFDIGDQKGKEVTLNQTIMLGALAAMLTGD